MKLCTIADAAVTVDGTTYLANVSLQDSTQLSKLDLLSGREFVWGFDLCYTDQPVPFARSFSISHPA